MAKLTINNPYFWAGLSGICNSIVNGTAPGDCALMTEEALAVFSEIANLSPAEMLKLAWAMDEFKNYEARRATV